VNVRATILCDNSVGLGLAAGVIGEHGFSCFVETDQGNFLFDTGQGLGLAQNARIMRKDLAGIRAVMLSHGHYDHTGGLPALLQIRGAVDVFAHPDIFLRHFSARGGLTGRKRYAGIPYRRDLLETLGANFRLSNEMVEVAPGVHLTGEIPRRTAFETGDASLVVCPEGEDRTLPDPLRDDLSLVIETDRGLLLILGCAHSGMVNVIEYVLEQMRRDRIYAVIGGTHLGFSTAEQFEETLKVIDRYKIEHIGVSHCTGLERAAMLHARLRERFFFGCVGASLEA